MTMVIPEHPRRKRCAGSTLIGALISTLILSIGMSALYGLYINNHYNSVHSRRLATALSFGRDRIETLRYLASGELPPYGQEQLTAQDTVFQLRWRSDQDLAADTWRLDITVQWQDNSGPHDIALKTLVDTAATSELPYASP